MLATIQFSRPVFCAIASALVIAIVTIARFRRLNLPILSQILFFLGLIFLALSTGDPIWHRTSPPRITVMVDRSPSTRGASWNDDTWLRRRTSELIGARTFELNPFSSTDATRTIFSPPLTDAILLFSDCRFDLPAFAPPTFIVVDPAMETISDGAIVQLEARDDEVTIIARNEGMSRKMSIRGVLASPDLPASQTLGSGTFVFHGKRDPSSNEIVAKIIGGDRWPENDELRLVVAAQQSNSQRWWIHRANSDRNAPDNSWRSLAVDDLLNDPIEYLSASMIALDDIAADEISIPAQLRLEQFVRDLGGCLVMVGGENSFGMGGYSGTTLEALSPLSSDPPTPTRHWIFLLDASGSMAGDVPGDARSRWQLAIDAMLRALPRMPASDPISIGSFAQSVRWWSFGKSLAETMKLSLPPADIAPNGPTNLQAALEQLPSKFTGDLPSEVLIVSDADAKIDDPPALARKLKAAHIRVHLLATTDQPASEIAAIVVGTGGTLVQQIDPAKWTQGVRDLIAHARPDPIRHSHLNVTSDFPPLSGLIDESNITWLKTNASILASARDANQLIPIAASEQFGLGQTVAVAFRASADQLDAIERRFGRLPRDPRFAVSWQFGSSLVVSVDAIQDRKFLNGLDLRLHTSDEDSSSSVQIPQIAPGRYELKLPPARSSKLATIRHGNMLVDRAMLAGRYPPEFDNIGNDREQMNRLAQRTGGAVIEPAQIGKLQIIGAVRATSLASELAFVGCALLAIGLIHWRRSVR